MLDRLLPDWLISDKAKTDLSLLFALLAAVGASTVVTWLIRRWTSRTTVDYLDLSRQRVLEGLTLERHPIRLQVTTRKTDLLHSLDVSLVEAPLFPPLRFRRPRRIPSSVAQILTAEDSDARSTDVQPYDGGGVTIGYPGGIARGRRPFRLDIIVLAYSPFAGAISVRDDMTGRIGRVSLGIVEGPQWVAVKPPSSSP
jgi:hypothetical protein